uniref:Glycosyl transferase family 25 domain-containing protein n=1 Tax=Lotharella oceanica TaxID=641309 RepID=A0A7S2XF70_9EUKA|mmetsp:Transcript_34155/g.63317  ORF Transcript_34155/g.63317 Transcript_34155/m.63317 type:complete len:284 (+) Transcript_34155:47-898(+)
MHRIVYLTLVASVAARWKAQTPLLAKPQTPRILASLNFSSTQSEHIYIGHHTHGELGISVITLQERKEHVDNFVRNLGLEGLARIQPAVRKVDLSETTLIEQGELSANSGLTMGEVACSMSHREVLKHFLNNERLTHIVVFEDDAYLNPEVMSAFQKARNNTDLTAVDLLKDLAATSQTQGWHGLNLGRCWSWCGLDKVVNVLSGNIKIVNALSSLCTQAYIFTREGARIHLASTHPIVDAEDRARQDFKDFVYASTTPRIFIQKENDDMMAINVANDQPECV